MSALLDLERHARVAAQVLDAAAGRCDEVEVHVDGSTESFVRFADVGPTQCADREQGEVSLRVRGRGAVGWREAGAVVGSFEEADWRRGLERALAVLEHSPDNPTALALPEGQTIETVQHAVATERHGIEGKVAWIDAALRAAEAAQLKPAGLARTCTHATTVANSRGLLAQGTTAQASFALTASAANGASGIGQGIAADVADLDVTRAIERGVAKAGDGDSTAVFEPCETTVVLEPLAVSALLLFAAYRGFGARAVEEGDSFLSGRVGERAFDERLSIHDDAGHALLRGLPFDGEGVVRQRVALVEGGVLGNPVTDRAHAQRLGLPCTGHSPRLPSSAGPSPGSLVVTRGGQSLEELIRGVDDGLLVTQFHYTNLIDPRELFLTGMTRNGTFRIRNGELVGPVRNLRFTQSLTKALASLGGLGDSPEVVGALFDGQVVTPAMRIDGFRFTSTTDF